MANDKLHRRSAMIAAVLAGVLMFTSGMTYRVLAARIWPPVIAPPFAPDTLQGLPMQINGWEGSDVSLDEAIVDRTDADAYVNRRYLSAEDNEVVSVYVACGVRARDLSVHRPENCYRSAGWTLQSRRLLELTLANGMTLPCTIFEFLRGGVSVQRVTVLHCLIVDGQFCGDFAAVLKITGHRFDTVRYVAQMQIVASLEPSMVDSKAGTVAAFAMDLAPHVAELLGDLPGEAPLPESVERSADD